MNVLLITPGYISHYGPIAIFAKEIEKRGHEIFVATNSAIKGIVEADGFKFVDLSVWESSNVGRIIMEEQSENEQERLKLSYEATKKGMIASLRYQAENRLHDLMWQPEITAFAIRDIIKEIAPALTICVQLCYNATAALMALGAPFITHVTGHPLQLPFEEEIYGVPYKWPQNIRCDEYERQELIRICRNVQEKVTQIFNHTMLKINPYAQKVSNAFAATSDQMILFNYPEELMGDRVYKKSCFFLGASLRQLENDKEVEQWLKATKDSRPTVYVSFGTVFSVRGDVLVRVFQALKRGNYRVIVSAGVMAQECLSYVDKSWLLMSYVPQLQVLPHCDLVIGHGGNNTITEALAYGVPLIVSPFASDQFFSALGLEENGVGMAFDPNFDSIDVIEEMILQGLACGLKAKRIGNLLQEKKSFDNAFMNCCKKFVL